MKNQQTTMNVLLDDYGSVPINQFSIELYSKVLPYTVNGNVPVAGIMAALETSRRKNKNKRHIIFAMFGFFACFVLVNMGLTYSVITLTKESHVGPGGQLTQSGTGLPVSTGTSRSVASIDSNTPISDISQVSHLSFSHNGTTISSIVEGFAMMPCPFETDCQPGFPNALFMYTPDMTVVYHGDNFAIVNATDRMTTALTLGNMTNVNQFTTGRHLSNLTGECGGWCVLLGAAITIGAVAASVVTVGSSGIFLAPVGIGLMMDGMVGMLHHPQR